MLMRIAEHAEMARAVGLRRLVAAGPGDLNHEWIEDVGAVVVAVESGRHLEPDQTRVLAVALRNAGVDELTAIENDPLIVEDVAFRLEAAEEDLAKFEDEFQPVNVLLVPSKNPRLAVLFTKDDYKLVAGPRDFVLDVVGDLAAAKREFLEYCAAFPENDILQAAARYMDRPNEASER